MVKKIKINDIKIKCLDMPDVKSTLVVAENFNNEKIQIIIKNKLIASTATQKSVAIFIYKKLKQEYNTIIKLLSC